jgi:hypothetical protein
MDRVGVEPTTSAMLSIVELYKSEAGGFGMTTIVDKSIYILNQFIVLVSSLLQITLVRTEVWRAGFIPNELQRSDIQTQEIGGKRRT